jgi:tRNA G18 (ribose-2'-O)-methylase SpoU
MHDFGNERNENQIEGKNAVMEALKAGRPIDKLYIVRGEAGQVDTVYRVEG